MTLSAAQQRTPIIFLQIYDLSAVHACHFFQVYDPQRNVAAQCIPFFLQIYDPHRSAAAHPYHFLQIYDPQRSTAHAYHFFTDP